MLFTNPGKMTYLITILSAYRVSDYYVTAMDSENKNTQR